jgi:hypothetical protein
MFAVFAVLLFGCGDKLPGKDDANFKFEFSDSDHGWVVGFADYPEGEEDFYELSSERRQLPVPLDSYNGIYVSGNNHSDDLFMYLKKELSGLKPNTRYSLSFVLQIATNAPTGCVGIGGAPGESVTVKAGAVSYEPIANRQSDGYLRMNVDHGGNSVVGSDAIVVGNLANTQTDCRNRSYELKDFDNELYPFEVYTNPKGSVWAYFATDSGFEGTTSIYYTYLEISAKEI